MSDEMVGLPTAVVGTRPHGNGSEGHEPRTERTSFNPATGEVVGHVPLVGPEGIESAVAAAREAQPAWAALGIEVRLQAIRRWRLALVEQAEDIAKLIAAEQGKTVADALAVEVYVAAGHFRYLEDHAARLLAPQRGAIGQPLMSGKRNQVIYEPLGVVAVISPWNYPFGIPMLQVASALVAGNAVVLKPSPFTPLIGQKIAELGRQVGLPGGLLQVIHVDDADAPRLTSHRGVDKVIFTGSVATGRKVMASASAAPTPVVLELGGKDPAIVCHDADLDRAVPGIVWATMLNSGQTCASIERVYVDRRIVEPFTRRVVEAVKKLRVGNPLDPEVEIGPLTNERQLEIVAQQVDAAVSQGAIVLAGGRRLPGPGYFYEPTVLTNVRQTMDVMQEETFGPVLPIMPFDTVEEAVRLANDSPYGLTASVWTRDLQNGERIARQLRSGAVAVNDHACHWGEPNAAWGGLGQSGFGRTHGEYGLREMVNIKWVSAERRRGPDAWMYPYNEKALHLLRNGLRLFYGPHARRGYALTSLLLNPRTWQRVNLLRVAAAIRSWL